MHLNLNKYTIFLILLNVFYELILKFIHRSDVETKRRNCGISKTNQVGFEENFRLQQCCFNLNNGHTWMTLNFKVILISNNFQSSQKLLLDSETCQGLHIYLQVILFVQQYRCMPMFEHFSLHGFKLN